MNIESIFNNYYNISLSILIVLLKVAVYDDECDPRDETSVI